MHENETLDEWFARLETYRASIGQYSRWASWRAWVSPRIGHLRWRDITPAHLEAIRDALDASIAARRASGRGTSRNGELLPGAAVNVWSDVVAAVRIARRSKQRDLRALAGLPDPAADIEPPGERSERKYRKKTFLHPTEFLQLAASESVPLAWRELYTIGIYTFLRPGELRVLRWSDVDLRRRVLHVARGWHFERREVKAPKTLTGIRDVPIPPHLAPLLERLRRAAHKDELVAPQYARYHQTTVVTQWREHLLAAGVTRAALHTSTLHEVRANTRTWRDTGITWLAMSRLELYRIMRRAGHEAPRTTLRYVKQAEDLTGDLGEPFPPLPPNLVRGPTWHGSRSCIDAPPGRRHPGEHE